MFKNLRYYRFANAWPENEQALSEILENAGFEPCGPLTERSSGWVPIHPAAGEQLARRLHGADLVRLRSQSRLMPPTVVNEELDVRIDDYTRRTGEAPSARDKKRLKAEVRDELMPKALLKSDRIWGFIDLKEKLIGIDTAQNAAAERFLRRLRAAFGDLNIAPLQFRQPVAELLTRIFLADAPGHLVAGRECRMQDARDPGSIVRWSDFDLSDPSIRDHVAHGMRLTHLGIEYDNVMSCVLDENGMITKIRFIGMDEDNEELADPLARLDAEFVLLTGTLRLLIADLRKLLGGFA